MNAVYSDSAKDAGLRGVINTPPADAWNLERLEPRRDVAKIVSWVWIVTWDLGERIHQQTTLPYPTANLVHETGSLMLHGPSSKRFEKTLKGSGQAVGVKFRPGGIRSLIGGPVAQILDRTTPATQVFTNQDLINKLTQPAALDAAEIADDLQDLVVADATFNDPNLELVNNAIRLIVDTQRLTKVDELAELLATSRRSLQRIFHEYLGLGVKATIKRYRLQDAAEFAVSGKPVDWAWLANELGYYDQSHLIGEFKSAFGVPPQSVEARVSNKHTRNGA